MSDRSPPSGLSRNANGDPDIRRVGVPRDSWRDVYYFVLVQPWGVFYTVLISIYVSINCIFATLYWLQPGCIGEPVPGHWPDDFFFSFETIATVGYGVMHPVTLYAHLLVVLEVMFGVLAVPLLTGLTILKFARPTARVTFSKNAVITLYDGVPTLMFRLANVRANQIFEARINLTMLRAETTVEGRRIRRLVDLRPVRDTNPMFILTWSVMHRIDEKSPLFGIDLARMRPGELDFMAVMTGLDATTSATVHARHAYALPDVLIDHMFEDIIQSDETGMYTIDYRRLHAVTPVMG
jgi:inward rectifier potassium channel